MKNKTKKLLSLILAVLCIMTCFASVSFAATEYTSGIYTYTVSGSSATIVSVPETTKGSITIPETLGGYNVKAIGSLALYGCTGITEVNLSSMVTEIGTSAFGYCSSMTTISIPKTVTTIGKNAFFNCSALKTVKYGGSSTNRSSMSIGANNTALTNAEWTYNVSFGTTNPYNLGEETYSFDNYSDDDSKYGHCFGMAATSSGYYNGYISKSIIGGTDDSVLYSFKDTSTVRGPICHYLHIQGPGAEQDSMVAGGNIDLNCKEDIKDDWTECINYVKGHDYDYTGELDIGMWFRYGGGHQVNFLYYKKVSGQDRMYIYDNNYPANEMYYYMGDDGYVHEGTDTDEVYTDEPLRGIDLMDTESYFNLAPAFKTSKYIYADKTEITVKGAKYYPMKCGKEYSNSVMYEIPDGAEKITITPLVDDAEFTYCETQYSFGDIDEDTCGTLTVVTDEGASSKPVATDFVIGSTTGAKCQIKNINLYNGKSVNYYSTITFHPDYENVTDIRWHVEGASGTQNGDDFTVTNAKTTYKVWYTAKDLSGNEVKSEVETVNVRNSILDKIIAIIMVLLSGNAYVYDQR